jgi:hypothetical protein
MSILVKYFKMKPAAANPTAIFFLLLASLLACNDNNDQKSYQQNYHPQPAVVFANTPGTLQYNPKHGEPGHRHDIPDGAPLSQAPAFPASTANPQAQVSNPDLTSTGSVAPSPGGALNPAHGQPGHRCDIAVGEPLSAAPATTSVNTAAPAQKLNPAHGQPGHRCDIAVGAPLNSPASTPAPTTNTPAVPLPPLPSPVKSDSAQVPLVRDSSGNLVRLNPAHGQPGHDCSIAVGKPLKQ